MPKGESPSRDASREVNAKSYSKHPWMNISGIFSTGTTRAQGYDKILLGDRFTETGSYSSYYEGDKFLGLVCYIE